MNEKIWEAAYQAGLCADGTPDSWDSAAIERFGNLIVDECIDAIKKANTHQAYTTYQLEMTKGTMAKCVLAINERFERNVK